MVIENLGQKFEQVTIHMFNTAFRFKIFLLGYYMKKISCILDYNGAYEIKTKYINKKSKHPKHIKLTWNCNYAILRL